jgi:uncharacterized protein (TIGR00730 family)
MPGGFGTLDELTEVLTLIQTGKTKRIPVILVGTHFWQGLLEWISKNMVERGMINAEDMQLVQLIDEPANVIDAIFAFYEAHDIDRSDAGSQSHSLL